MSKKTSISKLVYKSLCVLFFIIVSANVAVANTFSDSSKKPLLAANKKEKSNCTVKEANVTFPAILCGNENQCLNYIEKFSNNRRAYLIRTYNRGKQFFPKVAGIFQKYNVPNELKILMALESAFNANAVSKAGAVGYWQIMDDVAREYGLKYAARLTAYEQKAALKKIKGKKGKIKTVLVKDDRKNFNKSTYAAARYLKDRSRNLDNDILLVVASYNCGVGNVWDAMERSGKKNPTFWDIKNYLPAETRSYVMNFITLNVIFYNYDKFVKNQLIFTSSKEKNDDVANSNQSL